MQERLSRQVVARDRLSDIRSVAGVDVGYPKGSDEATAAWAVLSFPDLRLIDRATACLPASFPYIPGLLSFRELPPLLEAYAGLKVRPDLVVCDGQGIAHPRRFGLACHLGLRLDLPSIGAAKSRLIGEFSPPEPKRGCWSPLLVEGETVGAVLCTKDRVKPIYVSSGHRVGLETSIRMVLRLTGRYKLPETTRAAHALSQSA
jgi:deoxyribonuclease V